MIEMKNTLMVDARTRHLCSCTPMARIPKASGEWQSARVAPQTVAGRAAGINCVKNETRSHETYKGTYGPSSLSSTLEVGW